MRVLGLRARYLHGSSRNTRMFHVINLAEPYTGEKATNPAEHVANLKAIVRNATKSTEYEETP